MVKQLIVCFDIIINIVDRLNIKYNEVYFIMYESDVKRAEYNIL